MRVFCFAPPKNKTNNKRQRGPWMRLWGSEKEREEEKREREGENQNRIHYIKHAIRA